MNAINAIRRALRAIVLFSYSPILLFSYSCVDAIDYTNTPEGNLHCHWETIDQRYCYFDYKQVDWDSAYAVSRARLHDGITSAQLFEVMTDMLSALQDGHVNLYSAGNVARYWEWKEAYSKNLDEELREAYLGTDYRIASALKYRILDDNIAYVVCESFSSAIGEGNIAEMLHYLRTCTAMVLDIRGNGGGQLDYAERLASHFTNDTLLVGYSAYKTGPAHDDISAPTAEYLAPSTTVRWQKPVVVVTNRECYSAANTFVRDMKATAQATILGDRTGGGGGMPYTSELPNGWGVRFSASPMYDAAMQHIEFGIEPDVVCELDSAKALAGEDSMIELARSLAKARD